MTPACMPCWEQWEPDSAEKSRSEVETRRVHSMTEQSKLHAAAWKQQGQQAAREGLGERVASCLRLRV